MHLARPPILIACSLAVAAVPMLMPPQPAMPRAETWKVIAWNDLGMHCMDSDYTVFSVLPPYNTIEAQVIDPNGKLIKDATGLSVTYEAVVDPTGSINRTSVGKTRYWEFAKTLYGGSTTPNTGLAGFNMPGTNNVPQAMKFDATHALFRAEGVPITAYDDGLHKRTYPMMRIVVRDSSNKFLASTDIVLPISDEMDCSLCHASGSNPDAKPRIGGWVYRPDHERDYRLNILKVHDERRFFYTAYPEVLKKAGYNEKGLFETARLGTPVLCARCHASNALPGTGMAGLPALTRAVHHWHAQVRDPITNQSMDSSTNRQSCYRCHPGSETRCLRGAMGGAVAIDGSLAMQCQDCHGNMSAVGDTKRDGWLDQPNCENCHTGTATKNNGQIRYTSAFESPGKLRQAVDRTFATNKDVPVTGKSLYRFSMGHGGLRCEACHGSTHAIYPSIHPNDNIQNQNHQGHVGTIVECASCHKQTPEVWLQGPHGVHPVGNEWVDHHGDAAEKLGTSACQACHGSNYRGTVLSLAHADRTFSTRFGTKKFFRGAQISCYACHNGPNSENANPNRPPVASNNSAKTATAPVQVKLSATDPDNNPLTLRIVSQPSFGRVALSGTTATYYPDPGFAGTDSFTFAAWDGAIDSNLGTVSVTRLATAHNYGRGYPGTGNKVPDFSASKPPVLGSSMQLVISNTSGKDTQMLMLVSTERASLRSYLGGVLLTEPVILVLAPLPGQGAQPGYTVPNVAGLVGVGVYCQVLQADTGATFGVAFSPGLELMLGR